MAKQINPWRPDAHFWYFLAIVVLILFGLEGCATTEHIIDSSLMSGNQNEFIGTGLALGVAITTDCVRHLIDSMPDLWDDEPEPEPMPYILAE